jgi:SAM-dependent methyltransferase
MEFNYDSNIYNQTSSDIIVPDIIKMLSPSSVIDIGCGTGNWLSSFKKNGVKNIKGIDSSKYRSDLMQIDENEYIQSDLKLKFQCEYKFDLALCLEFAEHIEEDYSAQLIQCLVASSDKIIFSAAVPNQGGTGHVNEQWPSYWVKQFKKYEYDCYDVFRAKYWDDERIQFWYRQNLLLFTSKKSNIPNLQFGSGLDLIHPNLYLQNMEYFQAELNKLKQNKNILKLFYRKAVGFIKLLKI